ncbi:unnamed protein product [Cylicostephanus goldi]|uniref:BIG2 domain-containing protein n=1 Tax=Cylicostephanus goldi TaxID=71465 RepID=A0A3P6USY3_CYLGO|nr:unnamed protein product [Cylicostephanus goldi]
MSKFSCGYYTIVRGSGTPGSAVITAELSGRNNQRHNLKSNVELKFVNPVTADPPNLVLWNEVVALGKVRLNHGSGYFRVHELPGAPFEASVKDSMVMVTPKAQGGGSLRIEDLCVSGDPLDIPVKITDIHSLVIYGPQFMEVGSEAEVYVDAVDEAGSSFSRDHGALSNAVIESADPAVHITKISGSRYKVKALSTGAVSLTSSAKSTSGKTLNARPHTIQVFSSFTLHPQKITVIPESTFQVKSPRYNH